MILLAIALASAPPGVAPKSTIPAFFTGQRLLEICASDEPGQCWMYVAGVLDGLFLSESEASQPSLCRAHVTNRGAAERVVEYLERHPDMKQRAASVAVKAAMESKLPCSTETEGSADAR